MQQMLSTKRKMLADDRAPKTKVARTGLEESETILDGDLVILYGSMKQVFPLIADATANNFGCKYGNFSHHDIVGAKWGDKVRTRTGMGSLVMLRPTPELWTESLPHRTQIIYSTDAAAISFRLGVKPGDVVVESGTGSGSMSHHFIRCLQPTGHLYTFEFNQDRADMAKAEFARHSLDYAVTVECRDVCALGFGDKLNGLCDSIFLDLPCPWLAIRFARQALKQNGKICTFSPSIEQVQKTRSELHKLGFHTLSTIECLRRPFIVKTRKLEHFFLSTGTQMVGHNKADLQDKINKTLSEDQLQVISRPMPRIRGHTSFLTFATLHRVVASSSASNTGDPPTLSAV